MIKTALLKLFSKEVIIKFLLDWFYAVSAGQWEAIKAKVKEAEAKFTAPGTGAEKAAWVKAKPSTTGCAMLPSTTPLSPPPRF